MSWIDCNEPAQQGSRGCAALETVVAPRARDLGGFEVRRVLPSAQRRMVGPFVFWDQMGPAQFAAGQGIDVRPHPHIGLATVTYLLRGEIMHRDSLGSVIAIRPGEMNLMTAGSGIVHSERTGPEPRAKGHELFGIQAWVALPKTHEECAAAFAHYGAADLPLLQDRGVTLRLIAGEMSGARSAVATPMAMIYADLELATGATFQFDERYDERGIYTLEGEIDLGGERFSAGQLLMLRPGRPVTVRAQTNARCMLLGGEPADGPRHIWWNFVSSSKDRIEQAKADWRAGRFAAVPGETEFIPLPDS
jgi:redox-sensitive bicupin YhaK (pirin superfamily)